MNKDLCWRVYYYNSNRRNFEKFNVFDHWRFNEDVLKALNECETKEAFAKRLRTEMFYYYNSKCEWEVIIDKKYGEIMLMPWIAREPLQLCVTRETDFDWVAFYEECEKKFVNRDGIKIDVFTQLDFKFDEFVDYIWENK